VDDSNVSHAQGDDGVDEDKRAKKGLLGEGEVAFFLV